MAFKKPETQGAVVAYNGPALCSWNDFGNTCAERGILSPGTTGGPWYCREHFYRMMRWTGMEGRRGNELPEPITSSKAMDDVRAKLKPQAGRPFAKYVRISRTPGEDDEAAA